MSRGQFLNTLAFLKEFYKGVQGSKMLKKVLYK